jgi:tetratricopeptide (TPR) repeat protein
VNSTMRLAACVAGLACAVAAHAQGGSGSATGSAASNSANKTIGRDTSPLNPENALEIIKPPAAAEENAYKAFKGFQSISNEDLGRKMQAGENFLKKYPATTYSPYVYSFLTVAYIQSGSLDKGVAAGEKDLHLNPKDLRTMAVLSQAISRMVNVSSPDAVVQLAKAESYGKQAIEGIVTLPKPDRMSDADFSNLKNQTLGMAHAGIGLVNLHNKNYASAIHELEQAVSLAANEDPTNFYLLGVANQNSRHFDKAEAAFKKCTAIRGDLQATCASGAEQAKRSAAQLASPK